MRTAFVMAGLLTTVGGLVLLPRCVSHSCEDLANCDTSGSGGSGGTPGGTGTGQGGTDPATGGAGGTGTGGGDGGSGGSEPPPWGFAEIQTAWGVTCAAMTDGFVRCWGDNQWGGVGVGSTGGTFDTPQDVSLSGVVQVTGSDRACARNASAVHCWGFGFMNAPSPWGFPGARWVSSSFLKASFELEHTCVVDNGGAVHCWGDNNNGQLGIPSSTPNASMPVMVAGLTSVDEVAAGIGSTCARAGSTVSCWGGIAGPTHIPTEVMGLSSPTELTMTGSTACVVDANQVKCWDDVTASPTTVMIDAIDVAAGWDHTCAVDTGGDVHCWGLNDHGQLGNASTLASDTPVQVAGLDDVKQVSAGRYSSCAVKNDSTGWCWGNNAVGQLGNGTADSPQTTPT
ncbi:MAG: hypothetical protein RIF41_24465, partial [Polyangiaceae bacterium]